MGTIPLQYTRREIHDDIGQRAGEVYYYYKRRVSHERAKIRRIIIPLGHGDVHIIILFVVVYASDARVYVYVCVCVQRETRKTRPIV